MDSTIFEFTDEDYRDLFESPPYFCGDIEPHEPHDDENTFSGLYWIHWCPGVIPLFPIEKECGS